MPTKNFTKVTQKSKSYCDIRVYTKNGYSLSSDMNVRVALEKVAKKFGGIPTGSGYCFLTKERDFGFAFPSRKNASNFAKKAVQLKLIKSKISVSDVHLNWEYGESAKVDYRKV